VRDLERILASILSNYGGVGRQFKVKTKKKNKKQMSERAKNILGRGVDSLYLYIDKGLPFSQLNSLFSQYPIGEDFVYNGLKLIRSKAYMKAYSTSVRIGAFTLFWNAVSAYIQVSSLGFEMRGFQGVLYWLRDILNILAVKPESDILASHAMSVNVSNWFELLQVSRIDVFCDFVFNDDFNTDQFKTRLRRRGIFISGENDEGKTYYFGSRSLFCIRLYVKSAEIEYSQKTYLKANWKEKTGNDTDRVWRLEFEYRKKKLEEIGSRDLETFDDTYLEILWQYGIEQLQYKVRAVDNNNLHREKTHPIWNDLNAALGNEYNIELKRVRKHSLDFRYLMARKYVLS